MAMLTRLDRNVYDSLMERKNKMEKIFKEPMTTAAAIDRSVHHNIILELKICQFIRWNHEMFDEFIHFGQIILLLLTSASHVSLMMLTFCCKNINWKILK
jgi:hypothetical protein